MMKSTLPGLNCIPTNPPVLERNYVYYTAMNAEVVHIPVVIVSDLIQEEHNL